MLEDVFLLLNLMPFVHFVMISLHYLQPIHPCIFSLFSRQSDLGYDRVVATSVNRS